MASAIIEKDIAGNPKGIAVVEFESEAARKVALSLSGASFFTIPLHLIDSTQLAALDSSPSRNVDFAAILLKGAAAAMI